ncbi:hypothetical protein [Peribacillus sp. SCS-37]
MAEEYVIKGQPALKVHAAGALFVQLAAYGLERKAFLLIVVWEWMVFA